MIGRIKEILRTNGLSVSAFAEKLGMEQVTVNNYILGKRKPSLELAINTLNAYPEISAEWLMRGKGNMQLIPDERNCEAPSSDLTPTVNYLSGRCRQLEAQIAVLQGQKGKMAV